LAFSLNHLLEWIVESNYDSIKAKKTLGKELGRAEEFCVKMRELQEFDIV